jgi:uncharacterized membrane protein YfbV (UPF0208 family)
MQCAIVFYETRIIKQTFHSLKHVKYIELHKISTQFLLGLKYMRALVARLQQYVPCILSR